MGLFHTSDRAMSMPRVACFIVIMAALAAMTLACRGASRAMGDEVAGWADSLDFAVTPAATVEQLIDYEGFRVSFNKDFHQPNWVAWELTADEVRANATHRRNSNFQPDMKIDGCADLADYRGSGMTRGHMCPAGDMKWSQKAMDDCFMLTNITPQAQQLNSGTWQKLEESCRAWAVRDSAIFIVCGPILTDTLPRVIGHNQVPVPERFFKVILAPYADPPRAIGFIMPNGYVPGGMQGSAVSVDEVEEITGIDFFYALPDSIETIVESECNFPRWHRRK